MPDCVFTHPLFSAANFWNYKNLFSVITKKKTTKLLLQTQILLQRSVFTVASRKNVVPEARAALDRFKMEAASEVGVNLKQGYNGDLTSKQAGSVGGQMVKKMIQSYEDGMK